jgi:hypothetical protein
MTLRPVDHIEVMGDGRILYSPIETRGDAAMPENRPTWLN